MPIRFNAADAHWRVAPLSSFSVAQKDWSTRGGSLTAHLRALGAVAVRVTREGVAQPWADEYAALGLRVRESVWVREVVLSVDGVPFVAAHSVAPLAASVGVWQATRRLRTRPLAELLYSDSSVARSALVSRRVTARHPLYRLAAREVGGLPPSGMPRNEMPRNELPPTELPPNEMPPHALVARRSVFERHREPLMVTECFLPALWAHLAHVSNPRSAAGSSEPSGDVPHGGHPRLREHGRPVEHTASRAHCATRAADERSR